MDFDVKVYKAIPLFGDAHLFISDTLIATWAVMAILIALAVVVRVKLKKFKEVPDTAFQNIVEMGIDMAENFINGALGEKYKSIGGWFFGTILTIWAMNMIGLTGFLRNPTADFATTLAFSLSTFFILHYMWMKHKKFKYLKEYFEPMPVFFPMNVVSEISVPISLGFRLFGNLLGGLILMGLIYGMFPIFLKIGIPAVLHGYFDVFSGSLQAFIFTILSMTFIRNKLPD
ncbi:ATP synthase subunit a [Clostridia bacterium]|nr:ATP synthase subunit a [Clostridia bacterium]